MATRSPGAIDEAQVIDDARIGRAWVSEGHAPEFDPPARRRRHRDWLDGRDDPRHDRQELGDPRRRTRSGGDFVPDLRQFAERGRAEHGEQHELRQQAAAHAPRQHVARAEPKHEHDAAESERDCDRDQERTRGRGVARGVIGALDFLGESRLTCAFGAERLHRAHRAETSRRRRRWPRQACPGRAANAGARPARRR